MNRTVVITAAIFTVGGLEAFALYLGHNGAILSAAFALIGALAGAVTGYQIGLVKTPPSTAKKGE